VKPEEILLVTFTKNVSFNMKEKVISKAKSEISKYLITAPITNFDSFGSKIIQSFGLNAPKIIGIEDQLSNYKLITENTILKKILLHSNNHARIWWNFIPALKLFEVIQSVTNEQREWP